VLSGAYAVLDGAPALVAAVDRFAYADSAREPELVTPEVRAALCGERAPWFDAAELRDGAQKLGLGSSAAVLVASLAALELDREPELTADALARRVFPRALAAHARAQGGGSGIDVAASAFGGVLTASRANGELVVRKVGLPAGVIVRVLALGRPASTPELIGRVRALRERDPAGYDACMGVQAAAAERALAAVESGDGAALVAALAAQTRALADLGSRAGAAIVTPELEALQPVAAAHGAALLPSGAGGGDVALWVAALRSGAPARDAPELPSITPLSLALGADGVQRADG
jgi:phosphomevalonate kinase